MTKKEIAKTIAEKVALPVVQVHVIVQSILDSIIETLAQEQRIELRNFGIFEVKQRKARMGRNPKTGETVSVPKKLVITFKPGQEMDERVSQMKELPSRKQRATAA